METEEQVERDARQLRREMRMRGHVVNFRCNHCCNAIDGCARAVDLCIRARFVCARTSVSEQLPTPHAIHPRLQRAECVTELMSSGRLHTHDSRVLL